MEWDCEPSTTQLGNRESIQGILSIGDRTIPIVSTEESSLSLDSFQTPSREKPVERRVLLPNMDQQEMKAQKNLLASKIAKLKALVAVSRPSQFGDADLTAVVGKMNEQYADLVGEKELWQATYAEIMDEALRNDLQAKLQEVLESLFAHQQEVMTRRAELMAIAPQTQATVPQPGAQDAQAHPGLDSYVQRKHKGEMNALARHIKEAALRILGSCRADEEETRWCDAADRVIRVAMKKMDTWEAMMENLQQEFTKYEGLVMVNAEHEIRDDESEDSEAETEYSQVRRLVGRAADRVEEARKDLDLFIKRVIRDRSSITSAGFPKGPA